MRGLVPVTWTLKSLHKDSSCRDLSQKFCKPFCIHGTSCRDQISVPVVRFCGKNGKFTQWDFSYDLLQGLVASCVLPFIGLRYSICTFVWIKIFQVMKTAILEHKQVLCIKKCCLLFLSISICSRDNQDSKIAN